MYEAYGCSNNYKQFTEIFGDTWITEDFTDGYRACVTGEEIYNGSIPCVSCKIILIEDNCEWEMRRTQEYIINK